MYCWITDDGEKLDYPGVYTGFNASHEAARAFGIIAVVFGGLALIGVIVSVVASKHMPEGTWFLTSGFVLTACIFECLKFVFFDSTLCVNGCDIDTGSRLSISACVLWFVGALLGCFTAIKQEKEGDAAVADGEAPGEQAKEEKDAKEDHHSSDEDTKPHDHVDDIEEQPRDQVVDVEAPTTQE